MSNELFNFNDKDAPFSEKLRPDILEDFIGQTNIVGEGTLLRKMVETKKLSSFILWGPPGKREFFSFNHFPKKSSFSY
ncbi:MAG TPA: hypothetical protein PLO89_08425, partial [Spirochaetota bacterium]|nr:hypothetical protein [Spirochaetota bacterium]